MSNITLRLGKGSPLTNAEVDANFTNLNTDKVESITSADGSVIVSGSGTTRDLSVGTAANTGTLISQVRNETGATLTKGTVVYISGAAGNKALVSKALASGDTTSAQTYGMVQADIPNNQNGYVVVIGAVSGLDTSAFPDGTQLYLSGVTAGTYTSTKPYAPLHLVYVGIVTYSHANQGAIEVKIQNGYEMDELHDVSAQSPTDGQMLVYNSTTGLWTKSNAPTITGGTINNTTIGATTPSTGVFTTLTATGQTSLGGAAGSESIRVLTPVAAAGLRLQVGVPGSSVVRLGPAGATVADFRILAPTFTNFYTGSSSDGLTDGALQARVSHTASAVNYVQVTGAATTLNPTFTSTGSDANVGFDFRRKGGGTFNFYGDSYLGVNGNNSWLIGGAVTGLPPRIIANGSDTNISAVFQSKGTGAIDLAAGSRGVNISNGGTVTALTRTATGSSYTGFPTIAISAPTTAGGVQATATSQLVAANTTIIGGGTEYTVNDVLTVTTGGGSSGINITVTSVSGGVITAASASSAALTSIPSGTVSVSGGTGTGATFTLIYVVAATFTITNAGSGYVEQPTVTFSGGGGSGAAAFARVGGNTQITGLGSSMNFAVENGVGFRVTTSSATAGDVWQALSTGTTAILRSSNATSNAQVQTSGTGGIQLGTSNGVTQCLVSHTASAVNYVQVTGAATGAGASALGGVLFTGSDTNVNGAITTKGVGYIAFAGGGATSNQAFRVITTSAISTGNLIAVQGSAAGSSPSIQAISGAGGSDANIDLTLTPKGTGVVKVGTNTVLHAGNYNTYAPTLTGTGASGSWGISVTGSAGSVAWSGVTGTPTTLSGYGITDAQATLVSGTSIKTVNGISVLGSGNIQIDGGVTSFNTRTGAVTLSSGDVTTALGFTPYNATNPSGYITSSALSGYLTSASAASTYLPLAGGTLTGAFTVDNALSTFSKNAASGANEVAKFINSGGGYSSRIYIGANPGADWLIGKDCYGAGNDRFQIGSWNGYAYIDIAYNTTAGTINFPNNGGLTVNGSTILHAGNYNSYAPTLTGGGASGTWGINVTGTASGETLSTVTGRGGVTSNAVNLANGANRYQGHFYYDPYDSNGNHYPHFTDGGNASGVKVNWRLYTGGSNSVTHYWGTDTARFATKLESTSRVDAPIFYDRDDTAYYINPNGSSQVSGSNFNFGAKGRLYDDGNFHIDGLSSPVWINSISNEAIYLNSQTSGFTQMGNSARSPIFYDSNDTTYYVDPNSTSIMKGIDVRVGSVIQFYTAAGSLRGYINVTDTDDNHFQIATSGGEDIVFKDGGLSGTRNFVIRGSNTGSEAYGSMRSPIFYDSNDTAFYTDPASISNVSLLHAQSVVVTGTTTDRNVVRAIPKGASASYNNTVTGAFKIRLPFRANDMMWMMTVKIYDYSGNSISEYQIGNYSYSAGAYQIAASFFGSNNAASRTVRLGNDGSYDCVWIGETSGTWNHPVIAVTDFMGGYANASASIIDDNWDISLATSFGTIGGTINPTNRFYSVTAESAISAPIYYDSNNTAYYTDPASATSGSFAGFVGIGNSYGSDDGGWGSRLNVGGGPHARLDVRCANDGIITTMFSHTGNGVGKIGMMSNHPLVLMAQAGSTGGYVYSGSVRSSIFYDSDDTTYYVDPNSTGVALRIAGAIRGDHVNWTGEHNKIQWHSAHMYFQNMADGYWIFRKSTGAEPFLLHADGWAQASGSWRAPLFYDSNDTSYYTDPNGTSRTADIHTNRIGVGQGVNSSWPLIVSGNAYLNAGGYGQAEGSWRAPIFYDSNNTGYYLDPNSTSNISDLVVRGGTSVANITDLTTGTAPIRVTNTGTGTGDVRYIPMISGTSTSSSGYLQHTVLGSVRGSVWGAAFIGVGGNDSYPTVAYTFHYGGYASAPESWRAQLFYDNNDTAYYLDPTSTSRLGYLRPNQISLVNNQDNGTPRWDFKAYVVESQHHYGHNSSQTMYLGESNPVIVGGDIRSPIFYDSNDTGWYSNPNGTSNFNRISTVRTNDWLYIDNNYGHSVVGVYDSYRYQGVFAMGNSYKLPADGTNTGNLYGMAWSHPNAGGAAGNLTDHGLLIINNGGFRCAISNSIVASANITAYSDERLKTNWRDMPEDYVTRLAKVKVGIYDRVDQEDVTQVGVSAQSFQQLLPQAIMTAKDEMQTLSVSYGNAALASAVELAKEVVDLRTRVAQLESLITKLIGD